MINFNQINQMMGVAKEIHQNGAGGLSRAETAKSLGFSQTIQFDRQDKLYITCWMLAQLNPEQLRAQLSFSENICIEKEGGPNSHYLDPAFKTLSANLKEMSPNFFLLFVLQISNIKLKKILSGSLKLTQNEIATIHLITLLKTEYLIEFEDAILSMFKSIESFRYEFYIYIKKIAPLVIDECDPFKPPLWIKFFDDQRTAKAPTLANLFLVSKKTNQLGDLKEDKVKSMLSEFYGKNFRIRIYRFGMIHDYINSNGRNQEKKSLYEAHKTFKIKTDISLFYRAYKRWKKDWKYREYWKN